MLLNILGLTSFIMKNRGILIVIVGILCAICFMVAKSLEDSDIDINHTIGGTMFAIAGLLVVIVVILLMFPSCVE